MNLGGDNDLQSTVFNSTMLFNAGNRKLNDKWRMQQTVFRAAIKAAKSGNVMMDGTIDDRVPCDACGRKFAAKVAERHIPLCKAKSKKRWDYNIIKFI